MTWAPDYLTLPQGKAALRIADSIDDAELPTWITAASRAIDQSCNRQFGNVALETRTYRRPAVYVPGLQLWVLDIDDVQNTTGMTVNGATLAASGAVLLPSNAALKGKPYTSIGWTDPPQTPYYGAPAPNLLAAPWGWTAIPANVIGAAKLQLNRWAARRDSPFGVAGSPSDGSEIRLLARLDPDVVTLLNGFRRRRKVG